MTIKVVQYIEIDVDYCANTYSVAPCTASIPTTGLRKCFNTRATCQVIDHFINAPVTLRFAVDAAYLPTSIDALPNITGISFSAGSVSLGEDLGQRSTLTVTFKDHPHSDTGIGGDKYLSTRGYDPFKQGTYWGKFRARQPFVRGRAIRWIVGTSDQTLAQMQTRHFLMDSSSGPSNDGSFTIVAKDILKLADSDRSQAPKQNTGFLSADIAAVDTTLTLSPVGIGNIEYPAAQAFAAIGGSEIVYYERDSFTKALLHFDGANNATVANDNAPPRHALTFVGTAKLSTTQKLFGTTSLNLAGATDRVMMADSPDWFFGTGDFTIDIAIFLTVVPTGAADGTVDRQVANQQDGASNGWNWFIDGTSMFFQTRAAAALQSSYNFLHGIIANTWTRFRLVRSGTNIFIFKDGISQSLGGITPIGSQSIPDVAAVVNIGGNGSGTPISFVDEFRILKGFAASVANYAVASAQMELFPNGDVFAFMSRGQFNTIAVAHTAQDQVQVCLFYSANSPADILYDLFVNYAGISPANIPLAAWRSEVAANFGNLFTGIVATPMGVDEIASEIIQQAALAIWWDDIEALVKLQVLRGIVNNTIFNKDNTLAGSLSVTEQPDKRVSQVWTYFGQINALTSLDDNTNYKCCELTVNLLAETNYGSPIIKKVFSRWIPALGRSIATRLNSIIMGRFSAPPRAVNFTLFKRYDVNEIQLAGGYKVNAWPLQDDTGAQFDLPVQVTRLVPGPDSISVETQESFFVPIDVHNKTINIDTDILDVNLRSVHDSLFPLPISGDIVTCIIAANTKVGSSSTSSPALNIGSWPSGVIVNVINNGRIEGRGGDGGTNSNGFPGGLALYCRYAINWNNASGQIWGGGGGGSGGNVSVGGSGGAGFLPGNPGSHIGAGFDGNPGTPDAGGASVLLFTGGFGGHGGGPALSGGLSNPPRSNVGGGPGGAIDGVSFITFTGAGDRRGTEVN